MGDESVAGLAVEYLFKAVRIPAPGRPSLVVHTGFAWNYTTVLNIIALAGFAVVYWLYKHRDTSDGRFAKDAVCGMQVEIAHAPAQRITQNDDGPGEAMYFCSDRCAAGYDEQQARPTSTDTSTATETAAQQHGGSR